jgi:predicted Zn-dependent protease
MRTIPARRQSGRALAAALCAALAATACSRNPATGQRQLSLISEAQEIQLGRENDQAIVQQLGLYGDSNMQRYVQDLGSRLAAKSERPNLPWTFRVVDDPVVNAFALPGGFIYVTRGIMAHVENEAQLAGIIGHEIGHVTARHSVSRMSSAQLAQFGLAVGSILSPTVERYAGLAGTGLQLLFLKYSRDDENQADELGVRYMSRTRYDANHMPQIFTMLDRISQQEGGGRVPEWLATHPNPGNRARRITQLVERLPAESVGTTVNEESYLRRLDGMVYGEDPREGFFDGQRFLHPGMRFQVDFPQGWRTANQKQAVGAVSPPPQQDAIVQVSLARGSSPEAAAQAFFSQQQGVRGGSASRVSVNGLSGVVVPFQAQSQQGNLTGTALFIEHGSSVFMVLGYAAEQRWDARQGAVEGAMQSFRPLTDQAALTAQPLRLDIVQADRAITVEQLARERQAAVPAAKLALLNQVEANQPLRSGKLVKMVTGQVPALGRRE